MNGPLTRGALEWLELLLIERFGHQFLLNNESSNSVSIKLGGSKTKVLIKTGDRGFYQTNATIQYNEWQAEAEGWSSPFKSSIPAPGIEPLSRPLIKLGSQKVEVNYDILGLIYWKLNRLEEIGSQHVDKHGRFMYKKSHACKYKYINRPVVDEWLHILGQVMQAAWPDLTLKSHIFSVDVSHDVDLPGLYAFGGLKKAFKNFAINILKKRDVRTAFKGPLLYIASRKAIHPQDPFNTFEWLMSVSEEFGLVSKFNFLCGSNCRHDGSYRPDDMRIKKLMTCIHERRHEIGLHPSYQSYNNPGMILQESNVLRRIMDQENILQNKIGSRMHYLRWKHPATLFAINDARIDFDSTLGYAARAGFRCGTCFEYPSFNTETQRRMTLRIRPLIAMEGSIIRSEYMGLGIGEQALEEFKKLKDKCRLIGGSFTLLWHNSDLCSTGERWLYKSVLSI
jgi:hypothetical protein